MTKKTIGEAQLPSMLRQLKLHSPGTIEELRDQYIATFNQLLRDEDIAPRPFHPIRVTIDITETPPVKLIPITVTLSGDSPKTRAEITALKELRK